METINDRIEQLINERFDGNKSAFAKTINSTSAILSNYVGKNHRSKPSIDMVIKICDCLGVNSYWLLTGKGDQYPPSSSPVNTGAITSPPSSPTVPPPAPSPHNDSAPKQATDADNEVSALHEQIKLMQQLLEEKERLIRVYEKLVGEKK